MREKEENAESCEDIGWTEVCLESEEDDEGGKDESYDKVEPFDADVVGVLREGQPVL